MGSQKLATGLGQIFPWQTQTMHASASTLTAASGQMLRSPICYCRFESAPIRPLPSLRHPSLSDSDTLWRESRTQHKGFSGLNQTNKQAVTFLLSSPWELAVSLLFLNPELSGVLIFKSRFLPPPNKLSSSFRNPEVKLYAMVLTSKWKAGLMLRLPWAT